MMPVREDRKSQKRKPKWS